MDDLTCLAPTGDICGEAATWNAAANQVHWVDINRFIVHTHDLGSGATRSELFDEPVVALSLTDRDGVLLVCLAFRMVLLDTASGARTALDIALPGAPEVRFNDGRTDPLGAFWVGSMGNNVGPQGENFPPVDGMGKLYRLRPRGSLEEIAAGFGIPNTLCWSPDRSLFYFGDTLKNEIRAYDYDAATGEIGASRPFLTGFDRGFPDGSAIDAEGYLWNCRFAGGCVVRVAPDGRIDRIVEMPVANVTTCCFGGPDLSTLFITTASVLKAESDRLAGSLFALRTDTRGLPENRFPIAKVLFDG